ncbi:MAG: macrolide ABC transporter ATP-binding protein [Dehalococcoidia bacterium]|nr:macrolide ABC transporter ATP-binding protein [Dehalococcoidia bacterium]MBA12571.1 macrolide ABC transporter ATP-binding protein [Chloroflexota bacterium]|tara:strand:+ start:34 stop:708 length:675 start_codon:yes stop_codon:yes gene_type:complete
MSEIVISTENLHKFYGSRDQKVHALRGIDLSIEEGEIVGVMGPSGCGKTTLLNCLSGLDSFDEGNISIQGNTLTDLNDNQLSELRAKRMGFVFQTYNLLPVLSAVENVELPLLVSGYSAKEARIKALEKLNEVELEDWQSHLPGELSGGQRQRVTLARALVNDPAIVWADEPTGNLDSENEKLIMDLLIKLNNDNNQTFVIVTHSEYVGGRANRIIQMKDGEIV